VAGVWRDGGLPWHDFDNRLLKPDDPTSAPHTPGINQGVWVFCADIFGQQKATLRASSRKGSMHTNH
jgi:hypothetical protein